ncbi:MAG: nuclear transport factor 2 family protein [Clostridiales bacterium]|nr:nuclear transport factor 2 family protein [Clostridiales bacterium]MDO4350729.1 nuclear transport factor 2 family protein [Eubacteriales bacterium]MDY4009016.1 nuclear transport factor 2 family protein [Candidatus Limiplasma sp.]
MDEREAKLRLWFAMWLEKKDLGICSLFSTDAVYVESWGPEYRGAEKIRRWFEEWNTRGTVQKWDIRQFFHKDNQTVAEWLFQNQMDNGRVEAFEGMTLVKWNPSGQICLLKEFGCNLNRYDPYRDGPLPRFANERALWF